MPPGFSLGLHDFAHYAHALPWPIQELKGLVKHALDEVPSGLVPVGSGMFNAGLGSRPESPITRDPIKSKSSTLYFVWGNPDTSYSVFGVL